MSNGFCNRIQGHYFQPGFSQCDCGHYKLTYSTTASVSSIEDVNEAIFGPTKIISKEEVEFMKRVSKRRKKKAE